MSRRRSEEVFLFTLVDLLVQICFFGLFAFVAYQAIQTEKADVDAERRTEEERVLKAAGVSSLTELTDFLSRLAPPEELKGFSEYYKSGGRLQQAVSAADWTKQEGGVERIRERLEKLRKLEEGYGKPPCLSDMKDGKRVDRAVASVIATDSSIEFQGSSAELEQMLSILGLQYAAIRLLSHDQFNKTFAPLRDRRSDCLYSLHFIERTRFVEARDAARSTFRLSIRR